MMLTTTLVAGLIATASLGQSDKPNPYQREIDRGRAFLEQALPSENRLGYLALGVLALLKTSPEDEDDNGRKFTKKNRVLESLIEKMVEKISKDAAEFNNQEGNYTLAVCIMALIADDAGKHEATIRRLVKMLVDRQLPNGGWAYPGGQPDRGDTSQTQYVLLALWDAAIVGVGIEPKVWDMAFYWHICTQDLKGVANGGAGGFTYHPSVVYDPADPKDPGAEICTMGVAGYSSMLICQSQLPRLKRKMSKFMQVEELIRPAVDVEGESSYEPKTTPEMAHTALQRAENWVMRFTPFQDPYKDLPRANYYLYGFERVAALRREAGDFKKRDWYGAGGRHLQQTQKANGSWNQGAHWNENADTAFALLFLGRTFEKKLKKITIEVLPRGMAIGGLGGLPSADGSGGSAFQRQYERYKTQPQSSIDDIVKALENLDADVAEETAIKLEQLTPEQLKELVARAGGDTKKLRQWAYDKRPEARKAALTALSRTRDVTLAPILIDALSAEDEGVYTASREGLRYVSRNVDVFGLPPGDNRKPDAVKAGIARAKEWFASLNVTVAAFQEFTPPNMP